MHLLTDCGPGGAKMAEYVHVEVGEEVRSIAGYYKVLEEGVLEYGGREVLYLMKTAVVETSCCGPGGMGFISVPGYLTAPRVRRDEQGSWISEVERVTDEAERKEITGILKEANPHFHQVDFA